MSTRMLESIADARLRTPVRRVRRLPVGGAEVSTDAGTERFDAVVLACHSDQSLALLADPSDDEREVLGAIRYQPNRAVLHTDARVLPRRRRAWAAWNYERAPGDGDDERGGLPALPAQPAAAAAVHDAGDRLAESRPRARGRDRCTASSTTRIRSSTAPPSPPRRACRRCRAARHLVLRRLDAATAFTRTAWPPASRSADAHRARSAAERRGGRERRAGSDDGQPRRRCSASARSATRACARCATPSPTRPTSCCCRCARCAEQPAPALARNRFGLLSFHDADHGDGRADSLAWLDDLLAAEGIADANGEVWLHCYPRVLGFTFKPVSFWYCHRADGSLAAVVVEVNNTFGERHCYLLRGAELAFGREMRAAKALPRLAVLRRRRRLPLPLPAHRPASGRRAGAYEAARTVARIDHHDGHGLLLQTSVSGELAPLSARARRPRAFVSAVADAGRRRPHPLAGAEALVQARAVLQQAGRADIVHQPLSERAGR